MDFHASSAQDRTLNIDSAGDEGSYRRVVNEMNLFPQDHNETSTLLHANKETAPIHDRDEQEIIELDVNTCLNLSTISMSSETDQISVIRADLKKMNTENQRLKSLLNQANNNYRALLMHLYTFMQAQHVLRHGRFQTPEMAKRIEGVSVARQFMDLGQAGKDHHELAQSSISPENIIVESMEAQKINEIVAVDRLDNREESPERVHPSGWISNKVRKFNSSQTMTIRKARVSVRVRSEAAMVSIKQVSRSNFHRRVYKYCLETSSPLTIIS
ncbi:probable WRKY transcription factor 31 [Mangifera indica]|uniref:probable WRKY transcription factor 31 n=1 Tax=Mangifera indica TaxID=29780 RepID=UPI001CFAD007|nr:probable WRKY transcription factor 31 [Mangifera indica]